MKDLLELFFVIDTLAIVEGKTRVQRKLLEIWVGVNVHLSALAIAEQLPDGHVALMINDGHIALDGRPVECRGGGFPSPLAGFVPGRGTYGETGRRAHDLVKRMERRSRNQRRLVTDPQLADTLPVVCVYYSLPWGSAGSLAFMLRGSEARKLPM